MFIPLSMKTPLCPTRSKDMFCESPFPMKIIKKKRENIFSHLGTLRMTFGIKIKKIIEFIIS